MVVAVGSVSFGGKENGGRQSRQPCFYSALYFLDYCPPSLRRNPCRFGCCQRDIPQDKADAGGKVKRRSLRPMGPWVATSDGTSPSQALPSPHTCADGAWPRASRTCALGLADIAPSYSSIRILASLSGRLVRRKLGRGRHMMGRQDTTPSKNGGDLFWELQRAARLWAA